MLTRLRRILSLAVLGTQTMVFAQQSSTVTTPPATPPHIIGAVKVIVGDVKPTQRYYEQMFGMTEVNHYNNRGLYDEPIMGFAEGAHLAIFAPLAEAPIKKSKYPVALIFTPDFEGVIGRMEASKHPVMRLPVDTFGNHAIAVAYDPSGNALEIFSRPGEWEVGGSKLIVDDLQKAEAFFTKVFNATPGQRFATPAYDEVVMTLGAGPFLALFHPMDEAPLPKSQFPVVAIYTTQFDAVLNSVKQTGLGYREVKSESAAVRIIVAKDTAGNAIEIISGTPPPARNH